MSGFRYDRPTCPDCGEAADRRDEEIPGACLLVYDEASQTFGYQGETEVLWDGQMVQANVDGSHTLRCPNNHEWTANPLDEDGRPSPDAPTPALLALDLVRRLARETRGCTDLFDWVCHTALLDEAQRLAAEPDAATEVPSA